MSDNPVSDRIQSEIDENSVVLFMKKATGVADQTNSSGNRPVPSLGGLVEKTSPVQELLFARQGLSIELQALGHPALEASPVLLGEVEETRIQGAGAVSRLGQLERLGRILIRPRRENAHPGLVIAAL